MGRARAACLDRAARKAEEAAGRWRPLMGAGTSGAWRHSQLLPGEGDLGGGPETHRCGGMKTWLFLGPLPFWRLSCRVAGDLQAQRGCGLLWPEQPSHSLSLSHNPSARQAGASAAAAGGHRRALSTGSAAMSEAAAGSTLLTAEDLSAFLPPPPPTAATPAATPVMMMHHSASAGAIVYEGQQHGAGGGPSAAAAVGAARPPLAPSQRPSRQAPPSPISEAEGY